MLSARLARAATPRGARRCLALLLVATTGCGAARTGFESAPSSKTYAAAEVEQRLRTEIARWRGAPHRLGGTTPQGVDCSGLVMVLYEDLFGLRLPRATEQQVRAGAALQRQDLRPGDLVFFRPPKTRHVGIYLSDGEFAHVSSSAGVTVSRLDQPYWRQAYWTARRVLPLPEGPPSGEATGEPSRDEPPPSRTPRSSTGW